MNAAPTLGVEEEYLLIDPETGQNAPVVQKALGALPDAMRLQSRLEFRHSMLEMVTPVCSGLAELRRELDLMRSAAADAAAEAGVLLVAVGATPLAEPVREPADDPRFRAITRHYGPIAYDAAVCGCHVHVGVPDPETAILVSTRLRPWLPLIQAIAANSPLYQGVDTGHASWRSLQLKRWPALGPTPAFESFADYEQTIRTLVAASAMLDDSMILWYARPSAAYPTIEIRVADVCATPADTVLIAGLIRALVTVLQSTPGPLGPASDTVLEAAHWNAAHAGLEGTLLDVRTGQPRPAWELVDELVEFVTPTLTAFGDLEVITAELDRVRAEGTGAARQRRLLDPPETLSAAGVAAFLRELAVSP
ncbi:glutamate--cysteine ligase [Actinoplanes sp. TFC3]|uniref:carboxylate-amine ligase n=1 Tax=Actinoplanes sp. TFC3 TaxID=1710355 RepID=UPI00082BD1DB|nr:glutamate--cysteine ligase [Actinoplanes sp. TFC3]